MEKYSLGHRYPAFYFPSLFSFAEPTKAPTTLSLNQLVDKINAGQVSQIKVNGGDLTITMKDGSQAVAEKEVESGISETLKNLNVSSTALAGVDLEVVNQSGWDYWAGLLLPTVLPLLLFAAYSLVHASLGSFRRESGI